MKTTVLLCALLLGASMVCNGQWSYAYLSEPKCDMGSATLGNKVYFAGGGTANSPLKTVETYDVITREQVMLGSLSVGRSATRGVACGSKVLFAGGGTFMGENFYSLSNVIDIYNPATESWSVDYLSNALAGHSFVGIGNFLIVAGGVNAGNEFVSRMEIFYDKPKCQLRSLTLSSQAEVDNFATDYPYCQEIGVDVTISGSDIKNVSGLSMMSAIGGAFTIQNNPLLTSLEGLEGVTTLWGDLVIEGNPSLKSLKGLKNIDPGSIANLIIRDNDSLSICEVLPVCSYLASPGGSIDIQGNAPGCNSQEEIKLACLTSSGNIKLANEISIFPNPGKGLLVISAPNELAIEQAAIYNSSGQKVQQEKPVNNTVDISKLRPGMYFIEIRSDGLTARRKFVVE